jgi:hypothetical protein
MPRILDRSRDHGQSTLAPGGDPDPQGLIMPCRILARQASARPGQARISDIDETCRTGG